MAMSLPRRSDAVLKTLVVAFSFSPGRRLNTAFVVVAVSFEAGVTRVGRSKVDHDESVRLRTVRVGRRERVEFDGGGTRPTSVDGRVRSLRNVLVLGRRGRRA
jgi:hypothetical protein